MRAIDLQDMREAIATEMAEQWRDAGSEEHPETPTSADIHDCVGYRLGYEPEPDEYGDYYWPEDFEDLYSRAKASLYR